MKYKILTSFLVKSALLTAPVAGIVYYSMTEYIDLTRKKKNHLGTYQISQKIQRGPSQVYVGEKLWAMQSAKNR